MRITERRLRKIIRNILSEARHTVSNIDDDHQSVDLRDDSLLKRKTGFGTNIESKIQVFLQNNVNDISNPQVSRIEIKDLDQGKAFNPDDPVYGDSVAINSIGKANLSFDLYGKGYNNIPLDFYNSHFRRQPIIRIDVEGDSILAIDKEGNINWHDNEESFYQVIERY